MIHFAASVLGRPLDPWQQWLVIHLGEMLDDGRPRFRQVLVIVARQNGKTHLCTVLALFWMFVEKWPLIFGTSTDLEQAKDAWQDAVNFALDVPALAAMVPGKSNPRIGNGQQDFWTSDKSHYRIGAANRKGGRGKRIDRAIGDELREQHTWEAYQAAYNAMNARPRAQVVYITNMGDVRSVVLTSLRTDALANLEGEVLERPVAIFEWSAPPGTHPTDPAGHAAANPQYGRRNDPDVIIAAARRVAKPGADPEELSGFLTEIMCMAVDHLDPAIDPTAWAAALRPGPLPVDDRLRIAACVDVAPGGGHATLCAAAVEPDGRVRVEAVAAWDGPDALKRLTVELPQWVAAVRPRVLGWFPTGPAAAVDADIRDRRKDGRRAWPPRGVTVTEIQSDAAAVVMGFAAAVGADRVLHSGQALLDAHIAAAEKAWTGDRWVFTRKGAGHCDAAYAAAGAAHLARTMPVRRRGSNRLRTT